MDQPPTPTPGLRIVDDIDTLKALADPVRVSVLQLMMGRAGPALRGWTAKELAAELGEPQTKLYRHIKHLEERGLIRVAETRQVSGITEQRYVAAQSDLRLSRDLLGQPAHTDDTAALFDATIGSYRDRFMSALRSGRIEMDPDLPPEEAYRRPFLLFSDIRITRDRAVEFRERLEALAAEFLEDPDQDGGVPLNILLAVYGDAKGTGN
ncbi:ArsR/SmtB family transcription factor [Streptacidiphilus sp. PAMC 29251]